MRHSDFRRMARSDSPWQMQVGQVIAADTRGTHQVNVRLSGGRVVQHIYTLDESLAIGDQVLLARVEGRDSWIIVSKIQDQAQTSAGNSSNDLHPPANFTLTAEAGHIILKWDTQLNKDAVWQIQYNAAAAEDGATDKLLTRGSYYLYPAETGTHYFRIRQLSFISANNIAASAWSEWKSTTAKPVIDTFLELTDTPASYSGQAGKTVRVNAGATALEFIDFPAGVTTFLGLTDTPASYAGAALKAVRVNAGATGLEFTDFPAGVGGTISDVVTVGNHDSNYTSVQTAINSVSGVPQSGGILVTPGGYDENVTWTGDGTQEIYVTGLSPATMTQIHPTTGVALTLAGDNAFVESLSLLSNGAATAIAITSSGGAHWFFNIIAASYGGVYALDSNTASSDQIGLKICYLYGNVRLKVNALVEQSLIDGNLEVTGGTTQLNGGRVTGNVTVSLGATLVCANLPILEGTVTNGGTITGAYLDATGKIIGNADLLDGQHASAFSLVGHDHDADYAPIVHTHPGTDITTAVADSLALNGHADTYFATAAHDHDLVYAPIIHTHLWADITDQPATYTPSAHTHPGGDVTTAVADSLALNGHADTYFSISTHNHTLISLSDVPVTAPGYLSNDGAGALTWVAAAAAAAAGPAGSIQFNDSGGLGGDAAFVVDTAGSDRLIQFYGGATGVIGARFGASGIAHGMTAFLPTDIGGRIWTDAANGGLTFYSATDGNVTPFHVTAVLGDDATPGAASAFVLNAARKNGTGVQGMNDSGLLGGTLLQVQDNGTTVFAVQPSYVNVNADLWCTGDIKTGSGGSFWMDAFATPGVGLQGFKMGAMVGGYNYFYAYSTSVWETLNNIRAGQKFVTGAGVVFESGGHWEGPAKNSTLVTAALTDYRTITLPDASGTVALVGHTHLWANITNPPATYAPSAHTHPGGDVTTAVANATNAATAANANAVAGLAWTNNGGYCQTANLRASTAFYDDGSASIVGTLQIYRTSAWRTVLTYVPYAAPTWYGTWGTIFSGGTLAAGTYNIDYSTSASGGWYHMNFPQGTKAITVRMFASWAAAADASYVACYAYGQGSNQTTAAIHAVVANMTLEFSGTVILKADDARFCIVAAGTGPAVFFFLVTGYYI